MVYNHGNEKGDLCGYNEPPAPINSGTLILFSCLRQQHRLLHIVLTLKTISQGFCSVKESLYNLVQLNHLLVMNDTIEIVDSDEYKEEKLEEIVINSDLNDDSIKFKVMTWNLWCMVFTPRTLSNPHRCANYMAKIAKKEDWKSYNGLIICSFQEVWSWKTGIFPPFLLPFLGYVEYIPILGILLSFIFQFVSLLLGLLPLFKCLPITYNPKKQIAKRLNKFVPFQYYDTNIPLKHILDNGLLILSNKEADKYGSFGYKNHACDDSLAYKGFIYAYYKRYHCLVINTHLQSAGDGTVRLQQVQELKIFISKFTDLINKEMQSLKDIDDDYHLNLNKKLKIIATGDWNVDMTNHDLISQHEKRKQQLVRDMQLTTIEIEKSVNSDQSIATTVNTTASIDIQQEIEEQVIEEEVIEEQGIEEQEIVQEQKPEFTDIDIVNELQKVSTQNHPKKLRLSISQNSPIPPIIYRSKSYANLPNIFGNTFVKCNGCSPTCKDEKWGSLDHLLVNFEFDHFKEELLGREDKLSDHLMVKTEFVSSHSNLNSLQ